VNKLSRLAAEGFKVATQAMVLLLVLGIYSIEGAKAQIGNATIIPSLSKNDPSYGVNSSYGTVGGGDFATRHFREGNEGGIGSSFLGTTSPTAESRSVSRYVSPIENGQTNLFVPGPLQMPKLFSQKMLYSPAQTQLFMVGQPSAFALVEKIGHFNMQSIESNPYDLFWGNKGTNVFLNQLSIGRIGSYNLQYSSGEDIVSP
jgi:hypothetical protein